LTTSELLSTSNISNPSAIEVKLGSNRYTSEVRMVEASKEYVYMKFAEYYRDPSTDIPSPPTPEQREFGYLMFKERFMVRHKRFNSIDCFRDVLADVIPSDVYHSCAYYENPDFDMDKKGWVGSDIVFDIDADHIPSICDKKHDQWKCVKCGEGGRGEPPEKCKNRKCKGTKFEIKSWPCDLCIDAARNETIKLIDILDKDFGFSDEELHVYFSGHRGFHVHIENETVRTLDANARKEIVDYVVGLGLNLFDKKKTKASDKFRLHDFGWNKRLKDTMRSIINKSNSEELQRIVGSQAAELLTEQKDTALNACLRDGLWGAIVGVNEGTWKKLAAYAKEKNAALIDTVVTTDIHRLIRMGGTLHGKTGLMKVGFPAKKLQCFDPFTRAVAFKKGEIKVLVTDAPIFRMVGKTWGPYKNEEVELPVAAAIMLICKKRAIL
jgi:DNA primase small subunit